MLPLLIGLGVRSASEVESSPSKCVMLCQRFKRRIRQCGPERHYGRASDIYQGGETEPLMLTETVLAAEKSLDTEFAKSYS